MRISDWSSDVCSSDLLTQKGTWRIASLSEGLMGSYDLNGKTERLPRGTTTANLADRLPAGASNVRTAESNNRNEIRSEEHTSELQSLMRISYAVFCLKKKNTKITSTTTTASIHQQQ